MFSYFISGFLRDRLGTFSISFLISGSSAALLGVALLIRNILKGNDKMEPQNATTEKQQKHP